MSTMYNRALVLLSQAKDAIGKVASDDAYLDVACFETQQALELIMKTILTENNVEYKREYSIRYLLELLQQAHFSFDKETDLDILADTITSWEEGSRYGKGVATTVQTVQRVHNIIKSLNDAFLLSQEKNNPSPMTF